MTKAFPLLLALGAGAMAAAALAPGCYFNKSYVGTQAQPGGGSGGSNLVCDSRFDPNCGTATATSATSGSTSTAQSASAAGTGTATGTSSAGASTATGAGGAGGGSGKGGAGGASSSSAGGAK